MFSMIFYLSGWETSAPVQQGAPVTVIQTAVEQKNWSVARHAVGYARYDTPGELAALNELYELLRLERNFFAPQQKLISKTRQGAKVTKRYDTARTPHQRVDGFDLIDPGLVTLDRWRPDPHDPAPEATGWMYGGIGRKNQPDRPAGHNG